MHITVRYCAEYVDGNNGIGALTAEAASARSAQPCITPRFAPGGRNNSVLGAEIAECGALAGANVEKRPFRPRRALRALADGYANGALPCACRFAAPLHTVVIDRNVYNIYQKQYI